MMRSSILSFLLVGCFIILLSFSGTTAVVVSAFSPPVPAAAATGPTSTSTSTRSTPLRLSVLSTSSTTRSLVTTTSLQMGIFDDVQGAFKRLTARATASHILVNFGPDAEEKLQQIKEDIDDSPIKFAEMAQLYSACPSSSSGGSLGEFGRGQMVKEFDEIVFNEEIGKVHGPVETKFGYHLIYISDRND